MSSGLLHVGALSPIFVSFMPRFNMSTAGYGPSDLPDVLSEDLPSVAPAYEDVKGRRTTRPDQRRVPV